MDECERRSILPWTRHAFLHKWRPRTIRDSSHSYVAMVNSAGYWVTPIFLSVLTFSLIFFSQVSLLSVSARRLSHHAYTFMICIGQGVSYFSLFEQQQHHHYHYESIIASVVLEGREFCLALCLRMCALDLFCYSLGQPIHMIQSHIIIIIFFFFIIIVIVSSSL